MAQTIERLKISIPEYYKRTPEDLFNNELSINNRLYLLALSAGKFASSSLLFHDPQGVMDSFATKPHVDTPNHNGYFDPVVVGSVYEHLNKGKPRPYYVMLAEPFQNRLGAYVGGHLGGIPLDRKAAELGDGGVTMKMMRMTRYALKVARTPVVVFPSGTFEDRRSDSELGRGALAIAGKEFPVVTWGVGGTTGAVKRYLASAGLLGIHSSAVIGDVFMPEEKVTPEKLQESIQKAKKSAEELLMDNRVSLTDQILASVRRSRTS